MADQNYEILPHQLLEDLKYDVEALKKKLSEPEDKTNELILEIETLKDSIHELNDIFQKALEETHEEDIYKSISALNERIDNVISQNETIAKGMIAISDKLEDFMGKSQTPLPSLGASTSNMQTNVISNGIPTAPGMNISPGMPAPPSPTKKKKGFF